MYCPECGKKNDDDAVYCEYCGIRMETTPDDTATKLNTMYIKENYIDDDEEEDELETILSGLSIKRDDAKTENTSKQPYKAKKNKDISLALPKRKKNRKIRFLRHYGFIAGQVIICFLLIYSFQLIGKKTFNPEKYAEDYFESLADTDWNRVYEYLKLPESERLTKSNFIRSVVGTERIDYSNLSINVVSEGKDTATVDISYILADTGAAKTLTLELVKAHETKFLFFDVWKIDATDILAIDTGFQIQEGTQVTLDEETVQFEESNAQISYLFAGNHLVEVSMEDMETIKEVIYIPAGNGYQYYVDGLQVRNGIKENVMQMALSSLNDIFTASMNNKGFDEIIDLFANDDTIRQSMKEKYQEFSKAIYGEDGYGLRDIKFKNMTAVISQTTEESNIILTVEIKGEYDYSRSAKKDTVETIVTESETSEETSEGTVTDFKPAGSHEMRSGSGNHTTMMEFVKDGDSWLLRSFDFKIPEMN